MRSRRHPEAPTERSGSGCPRNVLVLTRVLPSNRKDGSAAYLDAIVRFLSRQGHHVHVHWCPDRGAPVCRVSPDLGARVSTSAGVVLGSFVLRWPSTVAVATYIARALWMLEAFRRLRALRMRLRRRGTTTAGRGLGAALVAPLDGHQRVALRDLVRSDDPDVVIANYAPLTEAFDDADRQRPLRVVLTHDVWHQRLANLGADPSSPGVLDADGEADLLSRADLIVAIQEADATTFRRMLPHHRVLVAHMPVEPHPPAKPGQTGRILYVGSQSPTNVEGLAWLLTEVWPLVRQEVPHAALEVVGNVCRAFSHPPDGVHLRGPVDDLSDAYEQASFSIAPYLRGSGLKIKIVESFAHGRACVTTTAGMLGLEDLRDRPLLVRDDARAYADAVIELLCDPVRSAQLGAASLRAARERFHPDVALAALAEALERPIPERASYER